MNKNTTLEIFCGTGGVGKTTLSLSRALWLSHEKKQKVALITIDPAKRLKDLIGLTNEEAGRNVNKIIGEQKISIDILLMDPETTFKNLKAEHNDEAPSNRILNLLMKPYGGMNEIMSVVELKKMIDSQKYDTVVLDTPPGAHFIDFLESIEKINDFFDSRWIDIFNTLSHKITDQIKSKGFFQELTSSGIKKILGYLENVTGKEFLDEFIGTVSEFYQLKNSFLDSIKLQEVFKSNEQSRWFLVTAADQTKIEQANELAEKSGEYSQGSINMLINKTVTPLLDSEHEKETTITNYFRDIEKRLVDTLKISDKKPFLFPEVISSDYHQQLNKLLNYWNKYEY